MRLTLPVLTTLLCSCSDRAPEAVPRLDLRAPAAAPAPRIALVPAALETQADFDRLEDDFLARRAPQNLVTALTMLADDALATPGPMAERDALLLQRLAILQLALSEDAAQRSGDPSPFTQKALDLAKALTDRAPDSPHALFLQGYIPLSQIGGSDRRDPFVDPSDLVRKPLRDAVVTRWQKLRDAAPTYRGPRAFTPERIQGLIDLIARASTAPTPRTSPPSTETDANPRERQAFVELGRLEGAPDGVRTTTCRDWLKSRPAEESVPLLRVSLFCATHLGDVATALPLITRLEAEDPAGLDPCRALARLSDRAPRESMDQALAGHPLAARCSR